MLCTVENDLYLYMSFLCEQCAASSLHACLPVRGNFIKLCVCVCVCVRACVCMRACVCACVLCVCMCACVSDCPYVTLKTSVCLTSLCNCQVSGHIGVNIHLIKPLPEM